MKKRMAMVLAVCGLMSAAISVTAGAATVGIMQEDGSAVYFSCVTEKAAYTGEDRSRRLLKEHLADLEKYGVSYDMETDRVSYEGELVRWIRDEAFGDYGRNLFCDRDGSMDLIVERDSAGFLVGVRAADKEEFAVGTKAAEALASGREVYGEGQVAEDTFILSQTVYSSALAEAENFSIAYEAADTAVREETLTSAEMKKAQEAEAKRAEEYAAIGITETRQGGWMLDGKIIRMLLDDDGYFCSNGEEGAETYVYVSRDAEGHVLDVQEVTGKEFLEHKAEQDER